MLIKAFNKFIATLCLIVFGIILLLNLLFNIDKPSAYTAIQYIHIYALPLVIALSLPRLLSKINIETNNIRYFIYCYQLVVGCLIIFAFPWNLVHDPANMAVAANYLSNANIEGFIANSSDYFQMYPYQFIYTLLITFFLKLSANYGIVLLKLFQLVMLITSTHYTFKIIELIKSSDNKAILSLSLILIIWFVPLIYTTYIYGTSLGMSLSIISIYYFIHYLRTNQMKSFLFTSLFILLAICFKLNFSIVLIAYIVFLVFSNMNIKNRLCHNKWLIFDEK